MQVQHDFLITLAMVLCVAGLATLIFQRLRQPVVFGYLLAGLIIGPHTSIPIVADEQIVHTLAELGVILLMYSLGLEFSLRKLVKVGPMAGAIAVGETSILMWLGYLIGRSLGWSTVESIYAGGIIAISSTTIIIKAFAEQGAKGRFTRMVFGILIVEDLIAIFLLSILTTIASGQSLSGETLLSTAGRLAVFLAGLLGVGLLIVPRLMRMVIRLGQPETTLVTSIGICFASALLALKFGYSVALGAFIAGSMTAESGHAKEIEHIVQPVRDMFGALFFVSVGMLINPALVWEHANAVVLFTLLVLIGKVLSVTVMSVLTGQDLRTSVQTGMSMAQIGEFSFIIASLGLMLGATGDFLYPVAVAVSAITALSTPWLIRWSGPTADWLDHKLPRNLLTFMSLYGSWIENMRHSPVVTARRSRLRRPSLLLVLDAMLLVGLIIGTALNLNAWSLRAADAFDLVPEFARLILLTIAAILAVPLFIGILRVTGFISNELATRAFPKGTEGKVDFAAAPRSTLTVTLQILLVLVVGVPILVITQPFLPLLRGTILFLVALALLAVAFWRRAANLQGHARAGAEIFVMALGKQLAAADDDHPPEAEQLQRIREALPGLGEPVAVKLTAGNRAVGQTLAELNLRGSTGATVLAIGRNGEDVLLPNGGERLQAGDVVFLAGNHRSVAAALPILQKISAIPSRTGLADQV